MTGNPRPLTLDQARIKVAEHSKAQENAERARVDAARKLAEAERQYRLALAQAITTLHADGVAWTVCPDIARGDKKVADLRYARDVARGVLDAQSDAAYRHAADRRALEQLVNWSMRVDVGNIGEPQGETVVFGRRAA